MPGAVDATAMKWEYGDAASRVNRMLSSLSGGQGQGTMISLFLLWSGQMCMDFEVIATRASDLLRFSVDESPGSVHPRPNTGEGRGPRDSTT